MTEEVQEQMFDDGEFVVEDTDPVSMELVWVKGYWRKKAVKSAKETHGS